jgi:2-polyprenyl-3-methyl-5-hydroxy-6-metoxy-1,4-benzoquinol methylase
MKYREDIKTRLTGRHKLAMKLTNKVQKWWDELTRERIRVYLGLFEEPGDVLCGLGCATGVLTFQVAQKINAKMTYGVDLDEKSLVSAHQKGIVTIKGDLNQPFPLNDEITDVISSDQVIEHLYNVDNFVKEIYRVLKPGGYAVIATENLSSWHNIFAILLGKQAFSQQISSKLHIGNPYSIHDKKPMESFPHIHIFTIQGLKDIFEIYGFRIQRVRAVGYFPFPVRLGSILERIDPTHAFFLCIQVRKPLRQSNR